MRAPMRHEHNARGFTMVELVLVLLIIVLLSVLALPTFSRMQKTTRVEEAAKVVISACNRARTEAQRFRTAVAVHFGDETSGLNPKPTNGILPPYGQIEISAMNLGYNDGVGWLAFRPYMPEYGYGQEGKGGGWYPHRSKQKVLTPEPLKFSPGVRIVTGYFKRSGANMIWGFPLYRKSGGWEGALGEIKRHVTVYDKRGGSAGYDQNNNYYYVLVFDTVTGEHRVVQAGLCQAAARVAHGEPARVAVGIAAG